MSSPTATRAATPMRGRRTLGGLIARLSTAGRSHPAAPRGAAATAITVEHCLTSRCLWCRQPIGWSTPARVWAHLPSGRLACAAMAGGWATADPDLTVHVAGRTRWAGRLPTARTAPSPTTAGSVLLAVRSGPPPIEPGKPKAIEGPMGHQHVPAVTTAPPA